MRPAIRKLIAMANDDRVSDKQFRIAIRHLIDYENIMLGSSRAMDRVWYDARIETERDQFVH